MIRYRECQKNHAAHLGSHVVDGCGEYMPAGNEGTQESLRCAACNCHRSFHRRDDNSTLTSTSTPATAPAPATTAMPAGGSIMIAFGGGMAGVESSSEEYRTAVMEGTTMTTRKKRYRTKFTEEQKERMFETAEKIGWKMKKECEESVVDLCHEIGIQRKVFKVWMHNNKQAFKRK